MGFYSDHEDLSNKIHSLKNNPNKYLKFAKNGAKRYFDLFNSKLIANI